MKIKKYTNGAWTDLDKPVKKYDTYTDEATTLPLTIEASATDAVENYQVYGASGGVGEATSGSEPAGYKIPILLNITKTDFSAADGTIEQGGWDASIGNPIGTYSSSTRLRCSNYITVDAPTDTITVKPDLNLTGYKMALQLTDDTGICISGTDWFAIPFSLSMAGYSDSIKRAYIVIRKSDNNTLVPSDVGKISAYVAPPNSSNYDLFVGDSKLYEDEYLDFVEQKVYKRTENLFNKNAKDTNNGYEEEKFLQSDGTTVSNGSYCITEYFSVEENAKYTVQTGQANAPSICFYNNSKNYILGYSYGNQFPRVVTSPAGAVYARATIYTPNTNNSMILKGDYSTVQSYIPYLQPTDPPTPFPTLSTYIGENNLSVGTTVQPEKVAVEYEGWKGVGDVEKYQNGEWSDNNDI